MDAVNEAIHQRYRLLFLAIVALIVLVADQATKQVVLASVPLNGGFEILPGYLNIVHVRNPGVAFGMMAEGPSHLRVAFLVFIALAALAIVVWLVRALPNIDWYLLLGYSLFFGGAMGNLVDRVRFFEVIDFVDVHWGTLHWPAFNVADSALTVGAGLFILHFILRR
jgi:signal peptidase II